MSEYSVPDIYRSKLNRHGRDLTPGVLAIAVSSGQIFRGFDSPIGMDISCLLNALCLLWVIWIFPTRSTRVVRSMASVLCVCLAAIAWACVATLWNLGFWPDLATPRLLSLISGFCALTFAALFACTEGTRGTQRLLDCLLAIECLAMVAGAVMRATGVSGGASYWNVQMQGRFIGLVGNPNITATLAAVFGVYALFRISRLFSDISNKTDGILFAIFTVSCVINLAILAVTGSRLPYIIALPAMLIGIKAILSVKREGLIYRLGVAAAVVMTGVTILYINGDVTSERMHAISSDWTGRVLFWTQVEGITERNLWLGYGLGGFSDIYTHFLDKPRLAEITWSVNSAHDIVIQLLMVGGLPYLGLIFVAFFMTIMKIVSGLTSRVNRLHSALIFMTLIMLSYASIDIDLDMPVSVTLFLLLVGLMWGAAIRNSLGSIGARESAKPTPSAREKSPAA